MIPELSIHELSCLPDACCLGRGGPADQQTLLIDHKNNEFKAASTAMALIAKYNQALDLVNFMSRLAREELVHYEQVLRIMKRRRIACARSALRVMPSACTRTSASGEPDKLVDTLVVGAYIEARTCERFDGAGAATWTRSWASSTAVCSSPRLAISRAISKLAYQYRAEASDVERTVERVRATERELIESPDQEFRFHSGVPQG